MYFRVADWLKAILFALSIVLLYLFLGTILHTILLFVAASFIVFLIHPIVGFLESRSMRRPLAILITFLLFFSVITIFITILGPIVIEQLMEFAESVPDYFAALSKQANFIQSRLREFTLLRQLAIDPDTIISQISSVATAQIQNIFKLIPSLIGFITDLILVLILSLYILIFLPTIDKAARDRLPLGLIPVYNRFLVSTKGTFARYVFGQFIFMTTIGILSGIGVWLVGLPYPALFGVWAGLTEIIPVLGPILGAIPAVIVALTIKPILAVWVVLVFIVIQQLENHVLAPLVLGSTVGLNPLLIFFGIIAGGEIAGIIGIFLAVPIMALLSGILKFIGDNFAYVRAEGEPDRIVVKNSK